jgi:Fe2+ transport system protein FeoA
MSARRLCSGGPTRLNDLRPGETARVVELDAALDGTRSVLADLGLAPGLEVRVIQRKPALVIEIDFTQVAVEDAVAGYVVVDRDQAEPSRP